MAQGQYWPTVAGKRKANKHGKMYKPIFIQKMEIKTMNFSQPITPANTVALVTSSVGEHRGRREGESVRSHWGQCGMSINT